METVDDFGDILPHGRVGFRKGQSLLGSEEPIEVAHVVVSQKQVLPFSLRDISKPAEEPTDGEKKNLSQTFGSGSGTEY